MINKYVYYTIYQITNLVNGKTYIGAHKTKDIKDGYMGSGKVLMRAIHKYGVKSFEKEILKVFATSKEMFELEAVLVNEDYIARRDTYNLVLGGRGGGGWNYLNANTSPEVRHQWCVDAGNRSRDLKAGIHGATKEQRKEWNAARWAEGAVVALTPEVRAKGVAAALTDNAKAKRKETFKKIGHSQGEKNSQYGTCWICNLESQQSKKIKKDDLKDWINQGWIKGRKIFLQTSPKRRSSPSAGAYATECVRLGS